jgi:hypothetical protein
MRLLRRLFPDLIRSRRSSAPTQDLRHRPRLECLEERSTPAVLSVNPASPTAYHSIQGAIMAAHPGDMIQVAQAVYTENILINKSLSLIGLPNGKTLPQIVGTGSNVGTESVVHVADNTNNVLIENFGISSPHGFNPTEIGVLIGNGASNITLNGGIIRHLRDETHPITGASQTTAVVVSPKAHNILITHLSLYNITYDATGVDVSKQFATGFLLLSSNATDGPSQVLIQHNYLTKIGDIGINITNGSHDVTVNYNTVSQLYGLHVSYGILVSGSTGTPTNLLIFNNAINQLAGKQPVGIAVLGTANAVQIVDNTVSGLTAGVGLEVAGHVNVSATENNFTGNSTGVLVLQGFTGTLTLHYNNINGNTHAGIENDSTLSVDAEANWWGSTTGPTSASNPGGTGDKILGPVDFSNWLTFAITT